MRPSTISPSSVRIASWLWRVCRSSPIFFMVGLPRGGDVARRRPRDEGIPRVGQCATTLPRRSSRFIPSNTRAGEPSRALPRRCSTCLTVQAERTDHPSHSPRSTFAASDAPRLENSGGAPRSACHSVGRRRRAARVRCPRLPAGSRHSRTCRCIRETRRSSGWQPADQASFLDSAFVRPTRILVRGARVVLRARGYERPDTMQPSLPAGADDI